MANQTVIVSVLADTKKFKKDFKDLGNNTELGKLGDKAKQFGKAMGLAAVAGGAALVGFGKKAVGAASDLEQSIGGVDAVFKGNSKTIHAWAKDADKRLGLSQNSYNELATVIGTTLKNSGIPMKDLTGQTDDLIERSADLAATFGGPVTESSNAVASALRGEYEPLRRYGISLSMAEVNARALADTGKTHVDQLTKSEKALATQALIMDQSTDAAGAFARESNTLAGQQERLKAQLENVAATAGTYLLPVITALVAWVAEHLVPALQDAAVWLSERVGPALQDLGKWIQTNVLPALQAFGDYLTGTVVPALQDAAGWVQENWSWLGPLVVVLGSAAAGYGAYTLATKAWTAATKLAKAAQQALNLVMKANPIGLVISAVAGLVAGILYLWETNEGFRNAVKKSWQWIKDAIANVWNWLTNTAVPGITKGISKAVTTITELPGKARDALAGILKTLWNRGAELVRGLIDGIVATVGSFVTKIKELPGKATSALSSAGSILKNRGIEFVTGLINGVSNKVGSFVSKVRELPGKATSALSSAGTTLKNRGIEFVTGLINGISYKFTSLVTYVKMIPGKVTGALRGAGTLLVNIGKDLIRGLVNGLWSMASWLGSQVSSLVSRHLPGPIKKILGIASPSRLFAEIGRDTMRGLQVGLADQAKDVLRDVNRFGTHLARTDLTLTAGVNLAPAGALGSAGRAAVGNTYHVHLEMLAPTPDVGRRVVAAIKDYERIGGTR